MKREWHKVVALTRVGLKSILLELPFQIISVLGLLLVIIIAHYDTGSYRADIVSTTFYMLEQYGRFEWVFVWLCILYANEYFWKDRDSRFYLIVDAYPVRNSTFFWSRWWIGAIIYLILLVLFMLEASIYQLISGTRPDIGLYVKVLLQEYFWHYLLILCSIIFFNSLFRIKLLSIGAALLLAFSGIYLPLLGVTHPMFHFADFDLGQYSDLSGFLKPAKQFWVLGIYWSVLGGLFLRVGYVMFPRGQFFKPTKLSSGLTGKKVVRYSAIVVSSLIISVPVYQMFKVIRSSGNWQSKSEIINWKKEYETRFKQLEFKSQPTIIDTRINLDIFPTQGSFLANGEYILLNDTDRGIDEIFIQNNPEPHFTISELTIDKPGVFENFQDFGVSIYKLSQNLEPGDSAILSFGMEFKKTTWRKSRVDRGISYHAVVSNGTLFDNSFFPNIGYDNSYEIVSSEERRKVGLSPKTRMAEQTDMKSIAQTKRLLAKTNLDLTVSTHKDQSVFTSGSLVKKWSENDRAYFRFKSQFPIENQFVILSGDYETRGSYLTINHDSVHISINYSEKHQRNIFRIQEALEQSLLKYSEIFEPYQYDQLNVIEFPRYSSFAQSIPNTIPFSEELGFLMELDEESTDIPFFITAHEVAHQWWGDKLRGRLVEGYGLLVESLAQYSAALVFIDKYGEEKLEDLILYEKERYLQGRRREVLSEEPLVSVQNQSYIHYGKGLINFMALRSYLGEEKINSILKRFLKDWTPRQEQGEYPTSSHLIDMFKSEAPDSLSSLVTDLFEKITFYDFRVMDYSQNAHEVSVEVLARKSYVDNGSEVESKSFNQAVPVGIYQKGQSGKRHLSRLLNIELHSGQNAFIIDLSDINGEVEIVIDPFHYLMERDIEDNSIEISQ